MIESLEAGVKKVWEPWQACQSWTSGTVSTSPSTSFQSISILQKRITQWLLAAVQVDPSSALSLVMLTRSWTFKNSRTQVVKSSTRSPNFVIHGPPRCIKAHGKMTIRTGPKSGRHRSILRRRMMAFSGCPLRHTCKSFTIWPLPSTSRTNIWWKSCTQARDSTDTRSRTQSISTCTLQPRCTRTDTTHVVNATPITMSSFISKTMTTNLSTSRSTSGCLTRASVQWASGPSHFPREFTRSQSWTRAIRPKQPICRSTSTQLWNCQRSVTSEHTFLWCLFNYYNHRDRYVH